jgi:hypothetical protein
MDSNLMSSTRLQSEFQLAEIRGRIGMDEAVVCDRRFRVPGTGGQLDPVDRVATDARSERAARFAGDADDKSDVDAMDTAQ